MLDDFLKISAREAVSRMAQEKVAAELKRLPTEELLEIIETGTIKRAHESTQPSNSTGWLDQFKGSPLMQAAMELEHQEVVNEAQRAQRYAADEELFRAKDQLNLQKRLLEIELAKSEAAGLPGPTAPQAPMAPPPAPAPEEAAAGGPPAPQEAQAAPIEGQKMAGAPLNLSKAKGLKRVKELLTGERVESLRAAHQHSRVRKRILSDLAYPSVRKAQKARHVAEATDRRIADLSSQIRDESDNVRRARTATGVGVVATTGAGAYGTRKALEKESAAAGLLGRLGSVAAKNPLAVGGAVLGGAAGVARNAMSDDPSAGGMLAGGLGGAVAGGVLGGVGGGMATRMGRGQSLMDAAKDTMTSAKRQAQVVAGTGSKAMHQSLKSGPAPYVAGQGPKLQADPAVMAARPTLEMPSAPPAVQAHLSAKAEPPAIDALVAQKSQAMTRPSLEMPSATPQSKFSPEELRQKGQAMKARLSKQDAVNDLAGGYSSPAVATGKLLQRA